MSYRPFGRARGDDRSAAGAAQAADPGALTAFIDQGSEFEGKLSFKDTVRVDGIFRGEIASENTLIVGEPGEVCAKIVSKTVVVGGSVVGDVIASRQLVLQKTARLEGAVETPSLIVEEGAILQGPVHMGKPAAGRPAAAEAKGRAGAPLAAGTGSKERAEAPPGGASRKEEAKPPFAQP